MAATAFADVNLPGAIVPQLFPLAHEQVGGTIRALRTIADEEFFGAVLLLPITDAAERKDAAVFAAEQGIRLTYCLIPPMSEAGLSLSASDPEARAQAVDHVRRIADEALEADVRRLFVGSGPAPVDPVERATALETLRVSIHELEPALTPDQSFVFEPLDVLIHKKQALGYTPEAVALANHFNTGSRDIDLISLCLDTAHMTLNGEDVPEAITTALDCTSVLHFCNAIQVPGHAMYGDHHPALGAPGYLDVPEIGRLMAAAVDRGLLTPERRTEVVVEQFNYDRDDWDAGIAIMRTGRAALEEGWRLARDRSA